MSGYYKKPAEAGKLYPCKKCNKTPTAGQDRYYQKISIDGPDGNKTEAWVGCVDFECFKAQGGSAEPAQQKKGFTPTKFPITDAPKISNLAGDMLDAFIKKYAKQQDATEKGWIPIEYKMQFFESMFKTLSSSYKP